MKYKIESAIQVLRNTPHVLEAILTDLSKDWTHTNEGDGTWSPLDVVGHLIINEETNFLLRARLILNNQEPQVLSRISMTAQFERFGNISLSEQLQLFKNLRTHNITALQNLFITDADLVKTAIHPELGIVQLSHVLGAWVAHDLVHIGQIVRVMAKQYKDEVGPFISFLRRLQ